MFCAIRILKTLCRKLRLPEDFDYQQLARLTPGYVGADLMALCREAAMNAVHRVLLEMRGQSQRQSQGHMKEASASRPQEKAPLPKGPVCVKSGAEGLSDGHPSVDTESLVTTELNTLPQQESGQLNMKV